MKIEDDKHQASKNTKKINTLRNLRNLWCVLGVKNLRISIFELDSFMFTRTRSLGQTFRLNMLLFTFTAIAIFAYAWISREIQRFNEESATLRNDYVESQKALLQHVVERAIADIQYAHTLTEARLKQAIQERVEEAHQVALNIYAENHGQQDPAAIQKMIKDALRPMRFNHGRGYYFAVNANGGEELFADQPELEGQTVLDLQDTQGRYVIREMIALAKQAGEGFYRYTWTKPNAQGKDFPKIAFIKRFEPYDWLLGTGEYPDDVQADIQAELLERLVTIRFGKEGYLFGSTYTGEPLFTNGQITQHTANLWEMTDPYGMKIIQAQRQAAAQPAGGFVRYAWQKLTNPAPSPKISFIKGFPAWQWMVGAGVYLDDIEQVIGEKKAALTQEIRRDILTMLGMLLALLLAIYLIAKSRADKIHRSFQAFTAFFETAATQFVRITETSVHFAEFERLAQSANRMLAERQRAEAELATTKILLEETFAQSPAPMVLVSMPDAVIRIVNPAFSECVGMLDEPSAVGAPLLNFTPSYQDCDISGKVGSIPELPLARALLGQKTKNQERKFVRKDGAIRWALVSGTPIYNTQGEIIAGYLILTDITERKQAEEALRRTVELRIINEQLRQEIANRQRAEEALARERYLLRTVIDNFPDHIYVKDTEGRILLANQGVAHTVKAAAPDELIGKTDFDFDYPPGMAEQYYADEQAVITSGQPLLDREEVNFDRDTKAPLWFLTTTLPFRDSQGNIVGILGIAHDITARKRAEEELRQHRDHLETVNHELQSFAYIVSHDLKAPLRGINQIAHWLGEDYAPLFDAPGKEMLDLLRCRVKRMDAMIDGILQYSRVGRLEGQKTPVNLNQLVREAIDLLAPPASMHIIVEAELPVIVGDPTRIAQVFQNLIGNALKFMDKPDGVIRIGCLECGDCWQFAVADNGPGIAAKDHEKIFQIFQTLAPRDERESTGIGLSIVKKIIERSGGKIWVDAAPGKGSAFFFTYPKNQD